MNKYQLSILMITILILVGCNPSKISNFNECKKAGYPIYGAEPRECIADGKTFTEETNTRNDLGSIVCTPEEKKANFCTSDYSPVCGNDGYTYDNGCQACVNNDVESFMIGVCKDAYTLSKGFHTCTEDDIGRQDCTREYKPVCGNNLQTFPNGCKACAAGELEYYTEGPCAQLLIDGYGMILDENGCSVSDGFEWDTDVGACIKVSEVDQSQLEAAKIAVMPQSFSPINVLTIRTLECEGCYVVRMERGDTGSIIEVNIAGGIISGVDDPESSQRLAAFTIANDGICADIGAITGDGIYNSNSDIWLFDITPYTPRDGCTPVCSVGGSSSDINWRCDGS